MKCFDRCGIPVISTKILWYSFALFYFNTALLWMTFSWTDSQVLIAAHLPAPQVLSTYTYSTSAHSLFSSIICPWKMSIHNLTMPLPLLPHFAKLPLFLPLSSGSLAFPQTSESNLGQMAEIYSLLLSMGYSLSHHRALACLQGLKKGLYSNISY